MQTFYVFFVLLVAPISFRLLHWQYLSQYHREDSKVSHQSQSTCCRGEPFVFLGLECPSLVDLLKRASLVNFDFCRYRTRWLKPTRFAVWNTACFDPLGKRCRFQCNKHFHCSSTGKRHHRLEGKASNNIPWTQIAQPYPTQLVREYAELVTDAINNEFRRTSWEAFSASST